MTHPRERYLSLCQVHGKELFDSRKHARKRRAERGNEHLRAYPCTAVDGMWHLGHLPEKVTRGEATAGDYYGQSEAAAGADLRVLGERGEG